MRTASLDFSGFSGQTAKSSPSLHARQNGQNGLNLGEMLYDLDWVRSTARSVTIGVSPPQGQIRVIGRKCRQKLS